MKKSAMGFLAGIIVASTSVGFAAGNLSVTDASHIKFLFNGVERPVTTGYKVLSFEDRTYVPARFVVENLGGMVDWNEGTQTVILKSPPGTVNKLNLDQSMSVSFGSYVFSNSAGYVNALQDLYAWLERDSMRIFSKSVNTSSFNTNAEDFAGVKADLPILRTQVDSLKNFLQASGVEADIISEMERLYTSVEKMVSAEDRMVSALRGGLGGNANWPNEYIPASVDFQNAMKEYKTIQGKYTYSFVMTQTNLMKAIRDGQTVDINTELKATREDSPDAAIQVVEKLSKAIEK